MPPAIDRYRETAKTLARNLLILAVLVLLGFWLPRLLPGSPLNLAPEEINAANLGLPQTAFNRFSEFYAPDLPLGQQLWRYLRQLLTGNWGFSFYYGLPVSRLLQSKLPWTLLLSFGSLLGSAVGGIALGLRLATREERRAQPTWLLLLVGLQAMPPFLLAVLLQLLLAWTWGWFPAEGAYPPGFTWATPGFLWQVLRHACLPLLVLILLRLPDLALLTRNVVRRIQREPYVEAARYRGVAEPVVTWRYIALNAWPEILARLHLQFLYAIAGSLLVEMVFSYPGLGLLLKNAVAARDYPLIQGIFLLTSCYAVAINLLFQLLTKRLARGYQR